MFEKLFFFFFFSLASLFAKDYLFVIEGFLEHEKLVPIFENIQASKNEKGGEIIIQINSSSGDFETTFHLAQSFFELRRNYEKSLTVYIQGKAVGPAAILPFIADHIIVTPFVAWGDVPYGIQGDMNLDRMRCLIKGLIDPSLSQAPILKQLADAMVDPHYQLAYEKGGKSFREDNHHFEPLILNLKGMQSLGLVSSVMDDEVFLKTVTFQTASGPYLSNHFSDELNQQLRESIHYNKTGDNFVGQLDVGLDRPIDQSTYLYFKFALEEFRKKKVSFVLLHLNTPGGEVLSSLKIVDMLQKMDLNSGIPIVALVDDWAVSAGAMLAYACRFIAVNPQSLIGAAEPVFVDQSKQMQSAPEKVNSALRAEFANLARFFDRNPLLAEAMVDKDLILVIRNHQIIKLNSQDEIRSEGANPDIVITTKGKLLTLNAEQLIDLGVADFMTSSFEKMALFRLPFFSEIPNLTLMTYEDWRITFFTILSNPIVMSLLFMGLVIGFYIEINTPGFGLFGSIGLACLALILLSSFSTSAIHWIEVIILLIGLILLAIELFVIPGFGIVGILGIVLTVIGLFALMLPGINKLSLLSWENFKLFGSAFLERLFYLSGALILSIVVVVLLARFYSHRFFRFSKLVLYGEQEGFVSGISRELMPEEGEIGEAVTPLRPSGKVEIGKYLYDAVAQTGYIDKHTSIEVVRVEGSRLIVRVLELKGK